MQGKNVANEGAYKSLYDEALAGAAPNCCVQKSLNSSNIEWDEHCDWFDRKTADDSVDFFIAELEWEPVGTVRFEREHSTVPRSAVVSLCVAPMFRGRGVASAMLSTALRQFFAEKNAAEAFGLLAGLSDRTLGIAIPTAAVALGACIIEKHFCLSRSEPGPDSAFSLEPAEFKAMAEAVRAAEKAVGSVHYGVTSRDTISRAFRRSLYVVEALKAGAAFDEKNVRSIRPSNGLPPMFLKQVLGRCAKSDIPCGTPLSWDLLA